MSDDTKPPTPRPIDELIRAVGMTVGASSEELEAAIADGIHPTVAALQLIQVLALRVNHMDEYLKAKALESLRDRGIILPGGNDFTS